MRALIPVFILGLFLSMMSPSLAAQTNPVPFVNNPLVPAAVERGGAGFTLTVDGAGFVSGAQVKWNGSARATTFVSPTRVTAAILATDISDAVTAFVTVSNPAPGGGTSNAVFFDVTTPVTSLAFTRIDSGFPDGISTSINAPTAITAFDLKNVGLPFVAVANKSCPIELECILQKASISVVVDGLALNEQAFTGAAPYSIANGDFNGDGQADLVTFGGLGFSILLNVSQPGSDFPMHKDFPLPSNCSGPFLLGDFDGDGHLDLALSGSSGICILPGNGDGTFNTSINSNTGSVTGVLAVGDFNGDGKLDLIVSNPVANSISILLGNGDGSFQPPVDVSTNSSPNFAVAADFSGDGKLDFAVVNGTTASIFLGNGDGSFRSNVDYPAGVQVTGLTIGDYNGDGVLDLAVSDSQCNPTCPAAGSVNVLLGNGDGSFQSQLDFANGGQPVAITTAEFEYNGEQGAPIGRPGFATANQQNNTVSFFVALPSGSGNPLPTISSISPSSAAVNSGAFTLTVIGTNFVTGSTVYFSGQPRATTFVRATQLTAAIQATDLSTAGTVNVYVANPPPSGGNSTPIFFNLYGPPPIISSLNPSSVVAGGPPFTLMVNGSNFVLGSSVNFNGTPRTTTFVSSTQLTIAISAGDIAGAGTINISVTVPLGNGSNGGTSGSSPLTILPLNTQPVVGALVPASTTAGAPAFTLVISGSGFTPSSVVTFNSRIVSSAFVSQTQLQAAIPASAIAVAGTPFVTVANPGGNPSIVVSFTINNPVPGASSLSPATVTAGSAATAVTVTGTNFNSSSTVLVNGAIRSTTFVNSTSLSAALLSSDLAHAGTLSVSVNNPSPGGGTTTPLVVTIEDFKMTVQNSSPPPVNAGQAASFTFTVLPALSTTSNPVTFAATGVPTVGTTATFSPATVPSGSTATNVILSIATTARSTVPPGGRHHLPVPPNPVWYLLGLAALVIWLGVYVSNGRVPRLASQVMLASILLIALSLGACGGGPVSVSGQSQISNPVPGTPAGTYSITVTATSATGSATSTVTLVVM